MTPTRRRVLDFMVAHCQEEGRPPTVRELCRHMGWASTNAAYEHLGRLREMGLLRHTPGVDRGWLPTTAVGTFLRALTAEHHRVAQELGAAWPRLDAEGLEEVRLAVENSVNRMAIREHL